MIHIQEDKQLFHLQASTFSYVLAVLDGKLINLYWGKPLAKDADLSYLIPSFRSGASFEMLAQRLPQELPSVGCGWYGEAALQAENADGNNITSPEYRSYKVLPQKPELPGLPHVHGIPEGEKGETLQIQLVDSLTGLEVVLSYSILDGALARSMQLTNHGESGLKLTHMASAAAPVVGSDFDVIHLRGAHSRERHVVRTPLGQAMYRIESQRGASGHEENPFLALAEKTATEHTGSVWATNLVYCGSFAASAQVSDFQNTLLTIGLNPAVHRWQLNPGETFYTPEAVLVYSDQGLNGMSQTYHHLYQNYLCRSPWVHRERPILINNWEATYFGFTEEKVLEIAKFAKTLGIELFVLDDGWFGERDDDHSSLGDWYVNTRKLPHGLKALAESIRALGMEFGLWFEPEMISPNSNLYRAHPDWCLHAPGRPRTEGRNQLILDLSRADVQQFIIEMLTSTLNSAPISYVKWDMNRNMTEAFSALLPADQQMEVQHRYMLGLYRVLEVVTNAFPEVLFESCSGGGGRFDAGMLYYMPQTWTSDDSDAVERLKIQYGTSFVYPASAMGAHVSASPNHQVSRVTTLSMRGDVALGGNFGFELDLSRLTPEELEDARLYVEKVKKVRSLTQNGVFTRLISPFNGSNFASWQFAEVQFAETQCASAKEEAAEASSSGKRQSADVSSSGMAYASKVLLCCYRVLNEPNAWPTRVYLKGLDPNAEYTDEEGNTYSGSALMQAGLPMTFFEHHDFTSHTILFTRKDS